MHCRVSTWIGDICGWVNHLGIKPVTQVNSAFHPSAVGKSSTGLPQTAWLGLRWGVFTCAAWQVGKGKGKGRALAIAPLATAEALRYMARTKQHRTYLPFLPSYNWYSFTDHSRMEG